MKARFNLSIFLFYIASAVYLFVEIWFNFRMLDVVSSLDISESDILDVKEFGRVASSVGFTLFALGYFYKNSFIVKKGGDGYNAFRGIVFVALLPFLITPIIHESLIAIFSITIGTLLTILIGKKKSSIENMGLSLLSVISIAMITFPALYYGKPTIVDNFIVEGSSGEDRLMSKYAHLIKEPLINGDVQLEDISINDFGGKDQPEAKAFLAMIGPIVSSSPQIKRWFENPQNINKLAKKNIEKNPDYQLDVHYKDYQDKGRVFKQDVYVNYKKLSEQHLNAKIIAKEEWEGIEKEKDSAWEKYKNSQKIFIDSFASHIDMSKLDLWDRYCKGRHTRECNDLLEKYTGAQFRNDLCVKVPLAEDFDQSLGTNYALEEHEFEQLINKYAYAVITMGVSLLIDTTDLKCWHNPRSIGFALATNVKHKDFETSPSNKYGLDLFIFSEKEFIEDERFLRGLILKINDKFKIEALNISLDKDWEMDNYEDFVVKITKLIQQKSDKVKRQKFGKGLDYGLGYKEFEKNPNIQKLIKDQLEKNYSQNFSFAWSKQEFYNKYFIKLVEKQILNKVAEFEFEGRKYDNGAELEERGKEYKRLIIVPPIAIFLSLLFSFTSLAKVIELTLDFSRKTRPFSVYGKWLVLFFIPLLLFVSSNPYLESKGWQSLKSEGESLIFKMTEFVLKIEPYLLPVGKHFNDVLIDANIVDYKKNIPKEYNRNEHEDNAQNTVDSWAKHENTSNIQSCIKDAEVKSRHMNLTHTDINNYEFIGSTSIGHRFDINGEHFYIDLDKRNYGIDLYAESTFGGTTNPLSSEVTAVCPTDSAYNDFVKDFPYDTFCRSQHIQPSKNPMQAITLFGSTQWDGLIPRSLKYLATWDLDKIKQAVLSNSLLETAIRLQNKTNIDYCKRMNSDKY